MDVSFWLGLSSFLQRLFSAHVSEVPAQLGNSTFQLYYAQGVDGLYDELKGSLSPLKNENKLDEDFYCTLHKFVLIRFIQRNQGHRDSVMHEFHSNVNKVNKAVAKVRTIGDRLPLTLFS